MRRASLRTLLSCTPLLLLPAFPYLMGINACQTSDADGDGWTTDDGDCDDTDATVHPGASEVCDDLDQDCDGSVDEDLLCDAQETECNGLDDNGNGYVDENCATDPPSGEITTWTQFNFGYYDWKVGCDGERYIKSTGYDKYVGVILCSSTKYKIFIAESPSAIFYSIGDGCGSGQDHCEFVGGTYGEMYEDYSTNDGQPGYTRCDIGDTPVFGTMNGAHWMGYYYECGVSIP